MANVEAIQKKLEVMPQEELMALRAGVMAKTASMKWIPSKGPQKEAYESKADVLLYGGQPGGGKTSLILGLAFNSHERSLIMRRQYTDLSAIAEDMIKIHGSRDGYNGSTPPSLKFNNGKYIELGAANRVGDEQHRMGHAVDFLGVDEATHFAEMQIRFLMGWVRSVNPKQRKRVVLATNPALSPEGLWVNDMFAPWLDPTYHNPAVPGELRWVVTDSEGKDKWVDGPAPVMVGDRMMTPLSRTFIPSSLKDNPFLANSGYQANLDAMPEPYRSILLGGFKTEFKDRDAQVIPTKWVQMAQSRWTPEPPEGVPMCSVAVDCSGGGDDPMIVACRHDGWYAPNQKIKGREIPIERAGAHCAGIVLAARRDEADIILDMGGGYGGPIYEHLRSNQVPVITYKGAEGTTKRTADGKLKFTNTRSAAIWKFREALDPGQPGGSPIALPKDPKLIADLTAPTFEIGPNGIKVEAKEAIKDRLGRSTDDGDAVVMAWWDGAKKTTHAMQWMENGTAQGVHRGFKPKVIIGGRQPLSYRARV